MRLPITSWSNTLAKLGLRCVKTHKPSSSESRTYRAAIENLEPRQMLTVITWDGSESSDFNDGDNWVGGAVPGSSDTARFTISDTVTVDTDLTVSDIEIQTAGTTVTIDIDSGKTLTVTNDVLVGDTNTDATLEVTGDGDLQVDGELKLEVQGDGYDKNTQWPVNATKGGDLIGDGTITGDIDHKGVISPGGSGTVATLTVDGDVDMYFFHFEQRSVLELDITSTGNDLLDVNSVDLDGYLEVDLEANYTPDLWTPNHVGDYFSVLQSSTDLSADDVFRTPNIEDSDEFAWRIIYDRDDKTVDSELGDTMAQPWIGNGKNEVILIPVDVGSIVIVDDEIVVDKNADDHFRVEAEGTASQGSWYSILSHSSTTAPPYAYENDAVGALSGRDPSHGAGHDDDNDYSGYAEWELTGLTPGSTQEVYITYPDNERNSMSAVHGWNAGVTYTIYDGDTVLDTIASYDQDHRPDDLVYENFPWERLGTYQTQTGSIVVRLEGPHDIGGVPGKIWDLEPRIADAAMAIEVTDFVPTPNDGNGPGRVRLNNDHPGAAGEFPSAYISSELGVRYADGQIAIPIAGGINSNAHGQPWNDTSQWTNKGELSDPDSGNGVAASQAPRLRELTPTTIVMSSGERTQFFDLVSGTWTPRYFAQDELTHVDGSDEFLLVDTFGSESVFHDFDVADELQGRLKSHTDGGDNASTTTYDVDGRISTVTRETTVDSVTYYEKYTHTYVASGDNEGKKEKVKLERKEGAGSWETVRSTKYTYYDSTDTYGNIGDVKLVETLDASDNEINTKYFRYYTEGESGGNVYDLKYSFTPQSYDRLKDAYATPDTATDAQVAPYADTYLEYDKQGRVTKIIQAREGSTTGSGTGALADQGVYTYEYYTSANDDGVNKWKTRTTETLPDGNQKIVYANSNGQTMLDVFREDPGGTEKDWITFFKYDDDGRIVLKANPSAVTGFDESKADLLNESAGNYQYLADSAGLINVSTYYTTTTATTMTAGGVAGYLWKRGIKNGETGTEVPQSEINYIERVGTYDAGTDDDRKVYFTDTLKAYSDTGGKDAQITSYDYTFFSGTTQVESITTTLPVVSTGDNGSGATVTTSAYNDDQARPIWLKDADGFLTYLEYDPATGEETKRIVDVDTTETSDFDNLPSGWSTPAGGGLHLITLRELDGMGRATKVTAPNGKVTYTVYKDADHEIRTYEGWTGTSAAMPTKVEIDNYADGYTDTIIMSAAPNHSGGAPTGTESISNIEKLTRSHRSNAGQVTHVDTYYDYTGLTYPSAGTEGTHFLRAEVEHDDRGRKTRSETPDGTIKRTVYDSLGRVKSVWIGTDDTPLSGTWSPSNPADMEKIEGNLYDDTDDDGDSDVGDGNLSRKTTYADGSTSYVTKHQYDFRNRRTDSRGPDGIAIKNTYDNLGKVTQKDTYADADTDFVIDTNELRMRTKSFYDDRQRVYQSQEFEVDQSTGTVGDALTTNYWFDYRGNEVKQEGPNGLFKKTSFDGAGRTVTRLTSIDTSETTYAQAKTADSDTVIEQTDTYYDPAGLVVTVVRYEREEDDTTTTGLLDGSNSYRNTKVTWYDDADRPTHTASFGTDPDSYVFDATTNLVKDSDSDGIPDEAEGTAREPNPVSGDWLGEKTEYDDAGREYKVTDNLGYVMHTEYDLMDRQVKVIDNYDDGIVLGTEDTDTDRTTEYIYSLSTGLLTTVRAYSPNGTTVDEQDTTYLYESDINASWRTNEIYPDSSDTTSSGTDQIKTEYDWQGRRTKVTDQRGVVHELEYDSAGRLSKDKITNVTLPSGVDGAVRRIETGYDDAGRIEYVTSYDAATGGSIVNQVQYVYNDYQLVSEIKQDHDGAVDGSTPSISFNYVDGASGGEAAYVRLDSIDYPDGRTIYYIYPSSGIGDALNRLEAIADDSSGTTRFVEYEYIGESRVVTKTYPDVSGDVILSYGASGTYDGWDRFSRIIEQEWIDGTTPTPAVLDHYTYEYDNNSNRTLRDNELHSSLDEDYTYDDLNRLIDVDRNGAAYQDWSLDSLGNWESFTDSGGTETRTHNDANEITGITDGGVAPTYDAAGNMISGPNPANPSERLHYTYDAWNRLVEVQDDDGGNPDTTLVEFEYDGRNFRIEKTAGGILEAYYYNDKQQVVETRKDGDVDPLEQFVWDPNSTDMPVVFFRDSNTDGTIDNTLYYTTDANGNVTALIDASTGNVVERYHYDPYGKALIYDANWNTRSSSSYDNPYTFTGRRLDTESGLYYFRARYYDPELGRFINRDPAKYIDGQNLYQYVQGGAPNATDPTGLARFVPLFGSAMTGHAFSWGWSFAFTPTTFSTGMTGASMSVGVGSRIAGDGQINGVGMAVASANGVVNARNPGGIMFMQAISISMLRFSVVGAAGAQFIASDGISIWSAMGFASGFPPAIVNAAGVVPAIRFGPAVGPSRTESASFAEIFGFGFGVYATSGVSATTDAAGTTVAVGIEAFGLATGTPASFVATFPGPLVYTLGPPEFARMPFPRPRPGGGGRIIGPVRGAPIIGPVKGAPIIGEPRK